MIALIDYKMGNLLNVYKALNKVGGNVRVIEKAKELSHFDKVILPGVGNFGDGMEQLHSSGFANALQENIANGVPLLGICLGMQMLMDASEEAVGVKGLGIFSGEVVRLDSKTEKVPHVGWNTIEFNGEHNCLTQIDDKSYFYFVHSYVVKPKREKIILGYCDYSEKFAAIIGNKNVIATQFHPEKSQKVGLQLLKNFVDTPKLSSG